MRRRAQREGCPVSSPCRPKHRVAPCAGAQRDGRPAGANGRSTGVVVQRAGVQCECPPVAASLQHRVLHARAGRGAALACVVLAVSALAGCSERLVGYTASYASTALGIQAEPPDGTTLRFRIQKTGTAAGGASIYARPGGALLKFPGFLPAYPLGVDEDASGFVVTIPLPEDAAAVARDGPLHGEPLRGELMVPYDTGVRSFTGVERFVPGTTTVGVSLTPVYAGPLTTLATNFGGFLRGLYSAR